MLFGVGHFFAALDPEEVAVMLKEVKRAQEFCLSAKAARVVDVNLNRLTEALKVIEDIVRFGLESKALLRRVRALRTKLGREIVPLRGQVILLRTSEKDLGRAERFDRLKRKSLEDVLVANCKRAEEAARVLEEVFKIGAGGRQRWSGIFKKTRFRIYSIEKALIVHLCGKRLDLDGGSSILLPKVRKRI